MQHSPTHACIPACISKDYFQWNNETFTNSMKKKLNDVLVSKALSLKPSY